MRNLLRTKGTWALALSGAVLAVGGFETSRAAVNVLFHAQLDEHVAYANIWGYTDPQGREYALLGATTGLAVVNLEDPDNPYETGFIPGPTSTWREVVSYSHYAYVVTEAGGGLDIVDLADPENPVGLANYTGFDTAHSIRIDVPTARLLINGSNLGAGGIRVLSLANPVAPVEIGSWETRYVHDCYKDGNRIYAACIFDERCDILNATNPSPPATPIASIMNYPNAFTHNAWTTSDGNYVMTTDETTGSSVRLWNVANLPTITEADAYRANPIPPIPHNVHIDGELAYISHYTLGVKIVDVTNRTNVVEVASYDTYLPNDGSSFDGCWGVFPYFGTHPNLFVASDIQGGLFVLEHVPSSGNVTGEVTKAGEPATKIAGASVQVLGGGAPVLTNDLGQYALIAPAGAQTLQVSAFAYQTQQVPINVPGGGSTIVNVALQSLGGGIEGTVTNQVTTAPIVGARVQVQSTPLSVFTNGVGDYDFASVPAGPQSLIATAFGFNGKRVDMNVVVGSEYTINFALPAAPVFTPFESGAGLWTITGINGVSVGRWQVGNPEPTNGGTVQTGDDHTPSPGVNAWITGLSGGNIGDNDVDGGATILTSPIFSTIGMTSPRVSYWRWYVSGVTTNPTTDFWTVELSTNGGANWAAIENTDVATPAWVNIDIPLGPPSGLTQFRFTARDTGQGSITEAGLDDFMLYEVTNQPGTDAPVVLPGGKLRLDAPRPNPFRLGESATLSFALPSAGAVHVQVFDVSGRRVATLLESVLGAGTYRVTWDGRTEAGTPVPAGVYFVKLRAPDGEASQRMLLLR